MQKRRKAARSNIHSRLSGMERRCAHRAIGRRYQGMPCEAIATKLSDRGEISVHNLRGESSHLVVLRGALQQDERTAGAFEVGEALFDLLGCADEAGVETAVGDGVVADGKLLLELRPADPLLEVGEACGRVR